jgi:hypothetical protein
LEPNNIKEYSTSFLFFKYSSLYLRKYLEQLYGVDNIEELENSIPSSPQELTDTQKSFMLTTTMLVNRVFTLVDSYLESLSYEMSMVSDVLVYQPFDPGLRMPTKALRQDQSSNQLVLNRLKYNGDDYKFQYSEESSDLINNYFEYNTNTRNPNTHHASGITTFGYIQKILLMSLSIIDMKFYYSWIEDPQIKMNSNLRMYEYFFKMSRLTIPSGWEIMLRNNSEDIISSYQGLLSNYTDLEIIEFESKYGELFSFVGGKQFNVMLI